VKVAEEALAGEVRGLAPIFVILLAPSATAAEFSACGDRATRLIVNKQNKKFISSLTFYLELIHHCIDIYNQTTAPQAVRAETRGPQDAAFQFAGRGSRHLESGGLVAVFDCQ
jgi:hypothetical protein